MLIGSMMLTHPIAGLHSAFVLAQSPSTILLLACGIFAAFLLLAFGFFFLRYFKLWFQAYMSVADVSLVSLIRMHFTKVNPNVVVQAKVMSAQAGLSIDRSAGISTRRLEAHYLGRRQRDERDSRHHRGSSSRDPAGF